MNHIPRRLFGLLVVAASIFGLSGSTPARHSRQPLAAAVPAPRDVLGFDPGDDRKLADWGQIVEYFKRLSSASNRVSLHEAGLTTERRPFIYALISSKENIRNLSKI